VKEKCLDGMSMAYNHWTIERRAAANFEALRQGLENSRMIWMSTTSSTADDAKNIDLVSTVIRFVPYLHHDENTGITLLIGFKAMLSIPNYIFPH
jgi:hypothetical protein